jgi:hypothetical protein
MAIKKNNPDTKQQGIIINDITLVAPNRQAKDIGKLKTDIVSAESVYFPNRADLYDLYWDVYSMDGFLRGIIRKRIDNVLNKTLKFVDKSGKEIDDVTDLINGKHGRELITKILESKIWGISGVEFIIGKNFCFNEIPRKHIKPEKGIISKSQYSVSAETGYKIDDLPMVWVIGKSNDLGLLLACSMYAIYKRGNFADWAQYVEIFGQPVRVIKYDAFDTQTRNELKTVLDESGSSLAMMIPKQADFEMLDGKNTNGDGKLQMNLKDACNSEMAIAILGNTETTSSSEGSGYAQAKVHSDGQAEIIKSDLKDVANELNCDKFLSILKSYGFNTEGKFIYEKEIDLTELETRTKIDTFVSSKVPVSDEYYYETYGVPKPDNYDELKAKMEADKVPVVPELETQVPGQKTKKVKKSGDGLTDTKKKKPLNLFFQNLADFFDQAQR